MYRSAAAVVLSFSLVGSVVGCATAPAPTVRRQRTVAASQDRFAHLTVSGTWDWMFRSQDDQGDERVEQEEWHLAQRGVHIEGHYDRTVTMLSVDERLFRCNQKLGFTKVTRVHVAGVVDDGKVTLREVSFEAKPGPCDDGARNLVEYSGEVRGERLTLVWGPQAGQTLTRRIDGGAAPLVQASDFTADAATPRRPQIDGPSVSAEVGGTWEWELRSIDAEGDERLEREEWHLSDTPDGVNGYYDRTVRRMRGEGTFTCNRQERIETSTRYTVVGHRFADGKLMLREIDYKAEKSDCDNAQRRLDSYQGHVSDADSLVLSWGPGNQLLRRKR